MPIEVGAVIVVTALLVVTSAQSNGEQKNITTTSPTNDTLTLTYELVTASQAHVAVLRQATRSAQSRHGMAVPMPRQLQRSACCGVYIYNCDGLSTAGYAGARDTGGFPGRST